MRVHVRERSNCFSPVAVARYCTQALFVVETVSLQAVAYEFDAGCSMSSVQVLVFTPCLMDMLAAAQEQSSPSSLGALISCALMMSMFTP